MAKKKAAAKKDENPEKPELKFYVVRNQEGQYFRRKGYGGYGPSWVDDIKKARTYVNIGGARGVVTFYATRFPKYGVPDIVVFRTVESEVLDEAKRIADVKEKKRIAEEKRLLRRKEAELKRAQEEFARAQMNLEKARLAKAKK